MGDVCFNADKPTLQCRAPLRNFATLPPKPLWSEKATPPDRSWDVWSEVIAGILIWAIIIAEIAALCYIHREVILLCFRCVWVRICGCRKKRYNTDSDERTDNEAGEIGTEEEREAMMLEREERETESTMHEREVEETVTVMHEGGEETESTMHEGEEKEKGAMVLDGRTGETTDIFQSPVGLCDVSKTSPSVVETICDVVKTCTATAIDIG